MLLNTNIQIENSDFILAGKILLLCQNFEQSCKFVLRTGISAEKFRKDNSRLEDWLSDYGLRDRFMGQLKKQAENIIPKDSFEILDKGIKARNYFCHELMHGVLSSHYGGKGSSISISDIRPKIVELLNADFIIAVQERKLERMNDWTSWNIEGYLKDIFDWLEIE